MKRVDGRPLAVIAAIFLLSVGAATAGAVEPVNPGATDSARRVLDYLYKLKKENKIMAGQHVYLSSSPREYVHVHNLTGEWPAVIAFDLLGFNKNPKERRTYLKLAKEYWKAGGLVSISWHETSPALSTLDEGGYSHGTKKRMSQEDFEKVVTPGTKLHERWLEHVDKAAGWLKELEEAGVVVLWRPYHELTGGWFWWGAKEPESFKKLWGNTYRRMTKHHGLNNLIWVWSAAQRGDAEDYRAYMPADCVDVGGQDIYRRDRDHPTFVQRYEWAQKAAGEKPVGLTEVGLLPHPETVEQRTRYVWFLIWGRGFLDNKHYKAPGSKAGNRPEAVKEFYAHPATVTRSELPDFRDVK